MFVVHTITDGIPKSHDYGNVRQFLRLNPVYFQAKDEDIFIQCVRRGFMYVTEYDIKDKRIISYHKTLNELLDEVAYNRSTQTVRTVK